MVLVKGNKRRPANKSLPIILLLIGFFVGRWSSFLFNSTQLDTPETGELSAAEKSAAALAAVADDVPSNDDGKEEKKDDDGDDDEDDDDDDEGDDEKKKEKKVSPMAFLEKKILPYECKEPSSLKFSDANMEPKISKINIRKIINGGYEVIEAVDYGKGFSNDNLDLVGMYTTVISFVQHSYGIFGSLGELGVYHGRYASCLFITARQSEKLIVADVFHKTNKNKDTVFSGDLEKFHEGLETYGLRPSDIDITFTGSTKEIPFDWSEYGEFNPFRFISIDAGRSSELVAHDLMVAACNLVKGGVIVLSDFIDPHWLAVTTSFFDFTKQYEELGLRPFLLCDEKLFMTNDEVFHTQFYDKLTQDVNLYQFLDIKAPGGTLKINGFEYLMCNRMKSDRPIADVWESNMY